MKSQDTLSILPFSDDQKKIVENIILNFDSQQLTWLAGYLSGLSLPQSLKPVNVKNLDTVVKTEISPVKILLASRTGNGAKVAQRLKEQALLENIPLITEDLNDYQNSKLKDEKYILVIVSTHGEGVPPIAAEEFYNFIHGNRAPNLSNTKFAVLALGDKSYLHFCKTGKDIDKRLEELGAQRITQRVDCDIDFYSDAENWIKQILQIIKNEHLNKTESFSIRNEAQQLKNEIKYDRKHPFTAKLLDKIKLSGKGSQKETFHYEISLEGSGITYEPGDAIGIFPKNSIKLVNEFLLASKLKGNSILELEGKTITLEEALQTQFEISAITPDLLSKFNEIAKNNDLTEILSEPIQLKTFITENDLVDLFTKFPIAITETDLIKILRKLQPRLYSISSSNLEFPEEVHLTVATVRYKNSREKEGTCSTFLSDRILPNDSLQIFIERNPEFKLPSDPNANIIMVGPGTGIAPYRAFLQERSARSDQGKNWLFFGDRNFSTDFLYQTELQAYLKKGTLSQLNVAFSRDSDKKIYVQHKLEKHAAQIYTWLNQGAFFYVCGDMKSMWKDVHNTLLNIVRKEGKLSDEQAENFIRDLKKQRRYQVDVY